MTRRFDNLVQRRIEVSDMREAVDAATGLLHFIPGVGTVIDKLGDHATNVAMYLYNMANSPYLPGRDFNLGRLLLEAGVYGVAGGLETVEWLNDVLPSYSVASRILARAYV